MNLNEAARLLQCARALRASAQPSVRCSFVFLWGDQALRD